MAAAVTLDNLMLKVTAWVFKMKKVSKLMLTYLNFSGKFV